MNKELIQYIYRYYAHLAPAELKLSIKYPYLHPVEQEEKKREIAHFIWEHRQDQLFINKCPNCNGLARTPQARQCRHCGFDWH